LPDRVLDAKGDEVFASLDGGVDQIDEKLSGEQSVEPFAAGPLPKRARLKPSTMPTMMRMCTNTSAYDGAAFITQHAQ
jgi:hypothetical protein